MREMAMTIIRWEEIIERVDKSAGEGGISPEQLQLIVDRLV